MPGKHNSYLSIILVCIQEYIRGIDVRLSPANVLGIRKALLAKSTRSVSCQSNKSVEVMKPHKTSKSHKASKVSRSLIALRFLRPIRSLKRVLKVLTQSLRGSKKGIR
jgi:hypothetical protein